ncbi:cellobiose 2-epimerase [soil metagenome]
MLNKTLFFFLFYFIIAGCQQVQDRTQTSENSQVRDRLDVYEEMDYTLTELMLKKWYPAIMDHEYGGYISRFNYRFEPEDPQDKMIVSQGRHIWSSSKFHELFPDNEMYMTAASMGPPFLKDHMWDKQYGGFFQLVDRQGNPKDAEALKTAYGNAFAIYGLASYFKVSGDSSALHLAIDTFHWLEKNSHDPEYKGYFNHLKRNGTPLTTREETVDGPKDQNSSIHLLEAFTELYQVWPDELLRERLNEMLVLIRDTIVTPVGSLTLFSYRDWQPISFKDSSREVVKEKFNLDHLSFGHDVETAFLMLEASHVLGIENDEKTLEIGKKMVDHSLNKGWDTKTGGFYDGGYYFKGDDDVTIVKDTKNWWAQAEGLNTLLMMADIFPDDPLNYEQKFYQLWDYTQRYLIDSEHGGWYSGGIDKQPDLKTGTKGNIWKTSYHTGRSLMNCMRRLKGGPIYQEKEMPVMVSH